MRITIRLAAAALAASAAMAGLVTPSTAEAKVITEACTKNLATGELSYPANFSSDYIIGVVTFKETSRKGGTAYGVCTIHLKFQPPD